MSSKKGFLVIKAKHIEDSKYDIYENFVLECLFVQAQVNLPGAINAPSELDRSVLLDNIKVNF